MLMQKSGGQIRCSTSSSVVLRPWPEYCFGHGNRTSGLITPLHSNLRLSDSSDKVLPLQSGNKLIIYPYDQILVFILAY